MHTQSRFTGLDLCIQYQVVCQLRVCTEWHLAAEGCAELVHRRGCDFKISRLISPAHVRGGATMHGFHVT